MAFRLTTTYAVGALAAHLSWGVLCAADTPPAEGVNLTAHAIFGSEPVESYTYPVALEGAGRDVHTSWPSLERTSALASYSLRFPKPLPLTQLQFRQSQSSFATAYVIRGDADGDEVYELALVQVGQQQSADRSASADAEQYAVDFPGITDDEAKSGKWITHDLGGRRLFGVKFVALEGTTGGYRKAHPEVQFRIFGTVTPAQYQRLPQPFEPAAAPTAPILGPGPVDDDLLNSRGAPLKDIPRDKRILTSLCTTLYDIPGLKIAVPLAEQEGFAKFKQRILASGCETVWFYGHRLSGAGKDKYHHVLWPSEVAESIDDNLFPQVASGLSEVNIRTIPWLLGTVPGITGDDRCPPPEAGVENACRLSGPWFGPKWAQLLKDAVRGGASGACVGPDEWQYYASHILNHQAIPNSQIPLDDPCRALFRQRYGLEIPLEPGDTEAWRKWVLFMYERVGELYKDWTDAVEQASAAKGFDALTTTLLIPNHDSYNNTVGSSNAWDLIGRVSGVDYLLADVYRAYPAASRTAKMLWGAHPNRRAAIMVHAGTDFRMFPEQIDEMELTIIPAIVSVFSGARGIAYYRLDYMLRSGLLDRVGRLNQLFANLDRLGFSEAHAPKNVAVLHSRAGEDWWHLKHVRSNASPGTDIDGYVLHKYVEDDLLTRGLNYDLYYLDHSDDVAKACEQYDVLVLPFPYSISSEAATHLKDAVHSGKTLVIVRAKGETDEFGVPHRVPALQALIRQYPDRVKYVAAGDAAWLGDQGHRGQMLDQLADAVTTALADRMPVKVIGTDRKSSLFLMEKGEREKFILAVNTSGRRRDLNINLNLPAGTYGVSFMNMDGVFQGVSRNESKFSREHLGNFNITLHGSDFQVLYVHPVD